MSQLNTAVSSHTSYAHRANSVPLQVFEQPQNAHIIQNDAEAIQVAKQLAHEFAKEASCVIKNAVCLLMKFSNIHKVVYGELPFLKHLVAHKLNIVLWRKWSKPFLVSILHWDNYHKTTGHF
jgi:16S rRNA G966 N2-methylase RsmD